MQIASSATWTARDSRSASLYATTLVMPRRRQARTTRRAISPRLAIRILLNTGFHAADRLAVLDRAAGLDVQFLQHPIGRADHVPAHAEHVDHADHVAATHVDAGRKTAARREVADRGRGDHAAWRLAPQRMRVTRRVGDVAVAGRGGALGRGMRRGRVDLGTSLPVWSAKADPPAALAHLEFAQLALGEALDE